MLLRENTHLKFFPNLFNVKFSQEQKVRFLLRKWSVRCKQESSLCTLACLYWRGVHHSVQRKAEWKDLIVCPFSMLCLMSVTRKETIV